MSRRIVAAAAVGLLSAFTLVACDQPEPQPTPVPAQTAAAPEPITAEAASEAEDAEQERQARLARAAADPVVGVIERAELCLHFAGEEGFDAARRAQIDKAFDDNKCDTVVADGDALKAARPQDAARIDAAVKDLRL